MSLNDYCPVQSSINRYCAELGEDEAFDSAVDNRKEELMNDLTPELIIEALAELPQDHYLWLYMRVVIQQVSSEYRDATLNSAHELTSALTATVENYVEQEALRQIRHERDNPDPAQEDSSDDD